MLWAQENDTVLGKLALPVRDVARNGVIKDVFTLQVRGPGVSPGLVLLPARPSAHRCTCMRAARSQDTEKGQMELLLTWKTCEIPEA